jgi:YrbI family 3-deoxy-D-manno-octulosonate 8-phosphate phosphatase
MEAGDRDGLLFPIRIPLCAPSASLCGSAVRLVLRYRNDVPAHHPSRPANLIAVMPKRPNPTPALLKRLKKVRLLVLDFDGVFTNNQVLLFEDGKEAALCNRSDGLGIGMLRDLGPVQIAVLTAEVAQIARRRCEKLRIDCIQVEKHKLPALKQLLNDRNIPASQAAFVGNDVNDIPCMNHVAVAIAVADAWPEVRKAAHAVTTRRGGEGAVREVVEWFLKVHGTSAAEIAFR